MDSKEIDDIITAWNNGKDLSEISKKTEIPIDEIKKALKNKMGDKFYSFDIEFKTENIEKIQKILYNHLFELLEDFHPDAEISPTSQKFIRVKKSDNSIIGIDIKATYYDSVVKSVWKYKKFHETVNQLFIILVSRRITKERLNDLIKDKPDNVTIIPYTNTEELEKFRKMIMEK